MEGEKGRMLVGRPRTGGSFEAVLALKDPEVDPNCRQFRNSLDIDKICRSKEDFLMDEGLIHLRGRARPLRPWGWLCGPWAGDGGGL